jgi:hypothetical protein
MAFIAPYETSITAGFNAFAVFIGFMEDISPAVTEWIEAKIPLQKQRIMDRRIRKCKRFCRKQKLSHANIGKQVTLDFADESLENRNDIIDLIINELK